MRQPNQSSPLRNQSPSLTTRKSSLKSKKNEIKILSQHLESQLEPFNKLQLLGILKLCGTITRRANRIYSQCLVKLKYKCVAEKNKKFGIMMIEGLFRDKKRILKIKAFNALCEIKRRFHRIKRISTIIVRMSRRHEQDRKRQVLKRLKKIKQQRQQIVKQEKIPKIIKKKFSRNPKEESNPLSLGSQDPLTSFRFGHELRQVLLSMQNSHRNEYDDKNKNVLQSIITLELDKQSITEKSNAASESISDQYLCLNVINNLLKSQLTSSHSKTIKSTKNRNQLVKNQIDEQQQKKIRQEQTLAVMNQVNNDISILFKQSADDDNQIEYLKIQKQLFLLQRKTDQQIYQNYYDNLLSITSELERLNIQLSNKNKQVLRITEKLNSLELLHQSLQNADQEGQTKKLLVKQKDPESKIRSNVKQQKIELNSSTQQLIKQWQQTADSLLSKISSGDSTWLREFNRKKKWLSAYKNNTQLNNMIRIDVELFDIISRKQKQDDVRRNRSLSERDCRLSASESFSLEEDKPSREKLKELSKQNLLLAQELDILKGKMAVIESQSIPRVQVSDLEEIVYNVNQILSSEQKQDSQYWFRLRSAFQKIQFVKLNGVVACLISLIKIIQTLTKFKSNINLRFQQINLEASVLKENIKVFSLLAGKDPDKQLIKVMKKSVQQIVVKLEEQAKVKSVSNLQELRELYLQEAQSKLQLLEVLQKQMKISKSIQSPEKDKLKQKHRNRTRKSKTSGDLQNFVKMDSDIEGDMQSSRLRKLEFSNQLLTEQLSKYKEILGQYSNQEQIILQRIEDYQRQLNIEKQKWSELLKQNDELVKINKELKDSSHQQKAAKEFKCVRIKQSNNVLPQSKVTDLHKELEIKQRIVEQLSSTIVDMGSKVGVLSSENQQLRIKISELEQKLYEVDQVNVKLSERLKQQQQNLMNNYHPLKTQSKIKIQSYKNQIEEEEVRKELEEKEEEIIKLEKTIQQMQKKNERMMAQLQRTFVEKSDNERVAHMEISQLKRQVEETQQKLEIKIEEIEVMKYGFDKLKRQRQTLERSRQNNQLQKDVQTIVSQRLLMQESYYKNLLSTSNASYDSIINHQMSQIQRLSNQINQHSTHIQPQYQSRSFEYQIQKLIKQVYQLTQTKDKLNVRIKQHEQTIYELNQRLSRHDDQLQLLRQRLLERMNASRIQKQTYRKQKKLLQEMEESIKQKQMIIDEKNKQIQQKTKQAQSIKQSEKTHKNHSASKLLDQIEKYQNQILEVNNQLRAICEKYDQKLAELANQKQRNADITQRFEGRQKELISKITVTDIVNQELSCRLQTLTEDYNSLRLLMNHQENQLKTGEEAKSPILMERDIEEGSQSEVSLRQKLKAFNLEESGRDKKEQEHYSMILIEQVNTSKDYFGYKPNNYGHQVPQHNNPSLKESYLVVSRQNKNLAMQIQSLQIQLSNKDTVLRKMNENWVSLQQENKILEQQLRRNSQKVSSGQLNGASERNGYQSDNQKTNGDVFKMKNQIKLLKCKNQYLENHIRIHNTSSTIKRDPKQPIKDINSKNKLSNLLKQQTKHHYPNNQSNIKQILHSLIITKSREQNNPAQLEILNRLSQQIQQLIFANNMLLLKLKNLEQNQQTITQDHVPTRNSTSNKLVMTMLQNMIYNLARWMQAFEMASIQDIDIPQIKLQTCIKSNNINKYITVLEQTLQSMISQIVNAKQEAVILQAEELCRLKQKLIQIVQDQIEENQIENKLEHYSYKSYQEQDSIRIKSISRLKRIGGLLKQYSEKGDPKAIEEVQKLLYKKKKTNSLYK